LINKLFDFSQRWNHGCCVLASVYVLYFVHGLENMERVLNTTRCCSAAPSIVSNLRSMRRSASAAGHILYGFSCGSLNIHQREWSLLA